MIRYISLYQPIYNWVVCVCVVFVFVVLASSLEGGKREMEVRGRPGSWEGFDAGGRWSVVCGSWFVVCRLWVGQGMGEWEKKEAGVVLGGCGDQREV